MGTNVSGLRKLYLLMVSDLTFPHSAGVAGCMATVLHDAIMNPAEGKTSSLLMSTHLIHTHTHTVHPAQ